MNKIMSLLKNKRLITFIVVAFFIIGLLAWKQFFGINTSIKYQTATVQRGVLVSSVSASGQMITTNIVSVATQATGTIKEVFVKDGDQVVAGQKIMEINLDGAGLAKNAAAYSSYLSAQNSLNSARSKQDSLQSALFKANQAFITDKGIPNPSDADKLNPKYIEENAEWLAAEADYKNQQNVIAAAQSALNSSWLSYTQTSNIVTSPISGTITNITYVAGMVISPTTGSSSTSQNIQRVAVVKNDSTPNASVDISEIDVYKLKNGQAASLTLDSIPGKTFTGKVISVDRIGSVTSNVTNYPVIIQFDTDSPQILPNMAVSANIIVSTKSNVLLVPSIAVQTLGRKNLITILKNGQPKSVVVKIGDQSDSEIEITSGLNEGDIVVTGTTSSLATQTTGQRSVFGGTNFTFGSRRAN